MWKHVARSASQIKRCQKHIGNVAAQNHVKKSGKQVTNRRLPPAFALCPLNLMQLLFEPMSHEMCKVKNAAFRLFLLWHEWSKSGSCPKWIDNDRNRRYVTWRYRRYPKSLFKSFSWGGHPIYVQTHPISFDMLWCTCWPQYSAFTLQYTMILHDSP